MSLNNPKILSMFSMLPRLMKMLLLFKSSRLESIYVRVTLDLANLKISKTLTQQTASSLKKKFKSRSPTALSFSTPIPTKETSSATSQG